MAPITQIAVGIAGTSAKFLVICDQIEEKHSLMHKQQATVTKQGCVGKGKHPGGGSKNGKVLGPE